MQQPLRMLSRPFPCQPHHTEAGLPRHLPSLSELELVPGKAVHAEREVSAQPSSRRELGDVIPEQKQLQLPLQDSSSAPSTQAASVLGRSAALFSWGRHRGCRETTPEYFPGRTEVVHQGRNPAEGCLEPYASRLVEIY